MVVADVAAAGVTDSLHLDQSLGEGVGLVGVHLDLVPFSSRQSRTEAYEVLSIRIDRRWRACGLGDLVVVLIADQRHQHFGLVSGSVQSLRPEQVQVVGCTHTGVELEVEVVAEGAASIPIGDSGVPRGYLATLGHCEQHCTQHNQIVVAIHKHYNHYPQREQAVLPSQLPYPRGIRLMT